MRTQHVVSRATKNSDSPHVCRHSDESVSSRTLPRSKHAAEPIRWHLPRRGIGLPTTVAVLVYAMIRVNWLPIIFPDSLMYLEHSNDIFGVGLVQVGFRQFGYPAWLAAIDSLAGLINVEPLALTVILQRLLLIIGAMMAVYVLRWWATFIVLVLALPTMVVYSNFILTEAIGVPVAVIAAVACVALFKPSSRSVGTVALLIASVAAAVLPMIRLHYGLLSVAIVVSIAIALLRDPERRRQGVMAILGIVASISVLVVSLSIENKAENDIFFPSLGSERVLF